MENSTDILNELKKLSTVVAGIEKKNVFTVPDGYFEYLADDIMMGIDNEYGLNNNNLNTSDADVPSGYFENLAGSILDKIKTTETEDASTEIRALSPMLYSIQNANVFEVPQDYFETSSNEILSKVKPQPKVISLKSRSNSFFKYAVAAAFTGVMALGVFKFTGSVNDTALPNYVTAGLQINDVDAEFNKLSNDDIVKYLEANGTDVKAALVANSIDKNELPTQEDYLLDDKALDNYLNSINLNDLKN